MRTEGTHRGGPGLGSPRAARRNDASGARWTEHRQPPLAGPGCGPVVDANSAVGATRLACPRTRTMARGRLAERSHTAAGLAPKPSSTAAEKRNRLGLR